MAGSFTLPTVLANLTAGNQPLSTIDGDFTAVYNPLVALSTFGNFYIDSGAANAYVITVSSPQTVALAAGLPIQFKAANANTGASTLAINALGAKNILNANGTALSAGQIPANAIMTVMYDGTQFLLLGGTGMGLISATPQASTSGTSIDFTSVPTWVKEITIQFVGVSTSGTDNWLVQLGDAGGIETAGYLGAATESFPANFPNATAFTAGFGILISAGGAIAHGSLTLSLENSATFTWVISGALTRSDSASSYTTAGSKSTSQALDRVRITTTGGAQTFDAGAINLLMK